MRSPRVPESVKRICDKIAVLASLRLLWLGAAMAVAVLMTTIEAVAVLLAAVAVGVGTHLGRRTQSSLAWGSFGRLFVVFGVCQVSLVLDLLSFL